MESFTLYRKYFAMIGINLRRSPANSRRFNFRNLSVIVWSSLGGISINKVSSQTSTFEEYTELVYRVMFAYFYTTCYVYIVWKTNELSELVCSLEDRIHTSE